MKSIIVLFASALLLGACSPDPIPELREQIHGQWRLSVDAYARYSPIFGYSFYHPTNSPIPQWTIDFVADGSAIIQADSTYETSWQHLDRDHLSIQIPSGLLLPNLGRWECKFLKYENLPDQHYLMGGGTYHTDTAVVNQISIDMYWQLTRIQ